MVQMVFVHGVTVRKDLAYQPNVIARDRRFVHTAFGGKVSIINSYWGDFGADPQWNLGCIPQFASSYTALAADMAARDDIILDAARQDFAAVIASLSIAALQDAEASGDAARLEEEEAFWAGAAAYAVALNGQQPAWLSQVQDDDDFFARLRKEAQAQASIQSLGLIDDLKSTAGKLSGGLSNLVTSPVGKFGREKLSPKIALFIGDVFRYLKAAQPRKDIRAVVMADIVTAAKAASAAGEPLVLAAHSMGAVILYDILSDPAAVQALEQGIGGPLKVDLFLTVGSQVAMFEELKVYESSNAAIKAPAKVPLPGPVKRWWNVFDKMDVLSFLTGPVFAGAVDFAVDTTAGVADAHGAYFDSMVFYQRLNKRLKADGLI